MATARDLITGALRDRRAIGLNATPTASEAAYGLDRLNAMLAGWRIKGIDFGHVTLALDDTLDVPDDHLQTVRLSLAERLNAFGGALDDDDRIVAEIGRRDLLAQYFNIANLTSDHPLGSARLATD